MKIKLFTFLILPLGAIFQAHADVNCNTRLEGIAVDQIKNNLYCIKTTKSRENLSDNQYAEITRNTAYPLDINDDDYSIKHKGEAKLMSPQYKKGAAGAGTEKNVAILTGITLK
jgi:hypothetical protein